MKEFKSESDENLSPKALFILSENSTLELSFRLPSYADLIIVRRMDLSSLYIMYS